MKGQWRGAYAGTNTGNIVVEIDDAGDFFEGSAYLYETEPGLPHVHAYIRTPNKDPKQTITVQLRAIHPHTGMPTPFSQIANLFPDVTMSETAEADIEWDESELRIRWRTAIPTSGEATISKSLATTPSNCRVVPIRGWKEFKDYAVNLQPHRYIFRGQPGQWRLRTAFHRTGRANLDKYLLHDMPIVHRHLSATTRHHFDVRDPLQNAAFFNLIQHHGFPTPLLDWTYSPFVAAHFAFSEIPGSAAPLDQVRIYVFDKASWCNRFPQIQNTADRQPHFSILEALGLENARMVPQQALSSFTNVDDIESYVQSVETAEINYLYAIDLPGKDRDQVVRELRLMGITHGALFPGLDGACADLRERFFSAPRGAIG